MLYIQGFFCVFKIDSPYISTYTPSLFKGLVKLHV